jgi:hypothetical protein
MPHLSTQDRALKQQKVSNLASSLVALLSCLPSLLLYKWLSCAEMNELLTSSNIDCLRASCTQATKLGHLECRRFLKTKVRFYRLNGIGIELTSTLQDERGANWSLPQLPSVYFDSAILLFLLFLLIHVSLFNHAFCAYSSSFVGCRLCRFYTSKNRSPC